MPVPSSINDLSTTPGSNSPAGSESPATFDDYMRTFAAFIAQLRDGKADSALAVLLAGSQTITGSKTFSSPIIGNLTGTASSASSATGPASSATVAGIVELATNAETQTGTDATRAVSPAGLGATALGMGQTWQDMTASRTAGVTYTNTTGRPIMVAIRNTFASTSTPTLTVGGVVMARVGTAVSSTANITMSVIVPIGSTYSCSAGFEAWTELR